MASITGKRVRAGKSSVIIAGEGEEISTIAASRSSSILDQGKRVASDAAYVGKKLLKSTGKAAWYLGTAVLVLVIPAMIQYDREMQSFQDALLGGGGPISGPPM